LQHYHGDPYGTNCLYSNADAVNNHPAQWGEWLAEHWRCWM
jgi:hypothetical protein